MDVQLQVFCDPNEFLWSGDYPLIPRVGDEIVIDDDTARTVEFDVPDVVIVTSVTWHIGGYPSVHICCEPQK